MEVDREQSEDYYVVDELMGTDMCPFEPIIDIDYEYTPQQSVQPVSQQLVSPVLIPARKPNVEIAQFTKTSYRERKSYSIEFKREVLEIYDRYRLHFKGNAAKKTIDYFGKDVLKLKCIENFNKNRESILSDKISSIKVTRLRDSETHFKYIEGKLMNYIRTAKCITMPDLRQAALQIKQSLPPEHQKESIFTASNGYFEKCFNITIRLDDNRFYEAISAQCNLSVHSSSATRSLKQQLAFYSDLRQCSMSQYRNLLTRKSSQ
ncbi:Hypothetical_protein [Hexamita inflata]|uniref:Hypothetical_protein n=1 Tax=Hexamita inflata TaxID=28002 RepID=A0AA86NP43_9EUKA|nr:Hypothetical protein HINF_LOCUS10798 [Hexamita inflata]